MVTISRLFALPWRFLVAYFFRINDWIKIIATRSLRPSQNPGVIVERINIPSRQGGRYIKAYKYTPTDVEKGVPLSVHLNWHASGYLLKRLGLDHYRCYVIASRLKCVVLDCDYAKGPERLFPAASDDAEDALNYVFARPDKFDTSRVSVGGSSAGGSLALAMSMLFGRERIKACFALYPPTKWVSPKDYDEDKPMLNPRFNSGLVLSNSAMKVFMDLYEITEDRYRDFRVSPIYGDLSRLPDHVLVACGDADTLHADGDRFVEKVHAHGTAAQRANTRFLSIPDEAHEFNNFPVHPNSIEWRDRLYNAAVETLSAAHR
ncbi:hypothetical protein MCUN1_002156 [Malassezia cuniculi]|uniref:Alpha/beta hydrolase fold-3 domain-containing protein n=1 Tax=Malassezia cuniculi TaxID=948313 RepID=A0AAF0ERM2_9BASI|nr:hypothetical protein MCUN1_002156 [Malassezia cuniculi]